MPILSKPVSGDSPHRRRKRRPWTVYAAPPVLLGGSYEGALILDDFPTPLGLALWLRYRDLLLWVSTPEAARSGLFTEDGEELGLPLWTLGETAPLIIARALKELADVATNPGGAVPERLIRACQMVVEWAEQNGYGMVELCYSDVAARIDPREPELAYAAGRAARRQALYDRAVHWFQTALGLARRQKNYPAYVDALLGWGSLEAQRGRHERAERLFLRAARASGKHRLRDLCAAAHHDLLALLAQQYRFSEAEAHGISALELYAPDHPRFVYLVHDIAELWAWQGYYAAALPVLQRMLTILSAPAEIFQVQANIARAAAGSGDSELFYKSWQAVADASRHPVEYAASALINVAEGAALLGLTRQAFEIARRGVQIARARGEAGEEARALQLIERLTSTTGRQTPAPVPEHVLKLRERILSLLQR